jgi:purine catabolism regulator
VSARGVKPEYASDPTAWDLRHDEVIGPLSAHDAQNGTALLESLRVLLERDRNVTATARELGVHCNTVIHRMTQVEALTGRNLRRVQDLAELWLAISAQEILSPSRPAGATANIRLT